MNKIILQEVKDYNEASDGSGFSWVAGATICEFTSAQQAMDYVEANVQNLPHNVRFFSGSASLIVLLNNYLNTARENA